MLTIIRLSLLLTLFACPLLGQAHVLAGEEGVSEQALQKVREYVDESYERLRPMFADVELGKLRINVFRQVSSLPASIQRLLHPGTQGLAMLQANEIFLLLDSMSLKPGQDLRTVVCHELVHILLHRYAGPSGPYIPRWFHEGLAQVLSGEAYLGANEEDIVFRVKTRTHLRLRQMRSRFPSNEEGSLKLAYAQSYSFVAFLQRKLGLESLLAAAKQCNADRTFPQAFYMTTNQPLLSYEEQWEHYLLHESGANYRVVLNYFFLLLLAGVAPLLLAIGLARRLRRDQGFMEKLVQDDLEDEE